MKDSPQQKVHLRVTDYSVSNESFDLILNEDFAMLETHPQPPFHSLQKYYLSADYISHTDSKRNLFENVYHLVRGFALKRKLRLIEKFYPKKGSLLDVGCGTGDFLKVASKAGWEITGIEPNSSARKVANNKTNQVVVDSDQISELKPHSYDVITLWHVLEHLPDLNYQFRTFQHLLLPNGTLLIAVPNFKSFDAEHYKAHWAAYDVPRHLWHFSQPSIHKLAHLHNMTVVETLPMKFDAFYVSLLSEKYKSGAMNYWKGFWNGWRSNRRARHSGEYSSLIYVLKAGEIEN